MTLTPYTYLQDPTPIIPPLSIQNPLNPTFPPANAHPLQQPTPPPSANHQTPLTHPHAIAAPCRHHHHHPPNPLTTTYPFPPTTSPYHTIPYCTPPTIPLIPPYHIQTRSIPLHHTHQNLPQPPLTPPPPHPHAFAPLLYHTRPPKQHPDPTHPPVFLHPSYHTLPQITKQPHNPTTRPHSLSMPVDLYENYLSGYAQWGIKTYTSS